MNIGIYGISGRMGGAILRIAMEKGHRHTGAFDAPGSKYIPQNAMCFINE